MKKILNILKLVMLIIITSTFTSCLKDEPFVDLSNLKPIVELPYISHKLVYTITGTQDVTYKFLVNLASANPLKNDLTVTIDVDDSRAAEYGTGYTPLPQTSYVIQSKNIVIKSGTKTAELSFTVNPANIITGAKNVITFVIKDAPGVIKSGNFGHLFVEIKK